MTITGITSDQLEQALAEANKEYKGNLLFNNNTPKSTNRHAVTLRCKRSDEYGARISSTGRRLVSASWEAHRDFMKAIFIHNPMAKIYTAFAKYIGVEDFEDTFPSTYYTQIGSMMQPCYIGETSVEKDGSKPF